MALVKKYMLMTCWNYKILGVYFMASSYKIDYLRDDNKDFFIVNERLENLLFVRYVIEEKTEEDKKVEAEKVKEDEVKIAEAVEKAKAEAEKKSEVYDSIDSRAEIKTEKNVTNGSEVKRKFVYIEHKRELFKILTSRQKSKISHMEQLVLEAYRGDKYCGRVVSDMSKLLENIQSFKNYGMVLPNSVYQDIRLCIEKNYLRLALEEINTIGKELTDEVLSDIFKMFCEYIKDSVEVADVNGIKVYPVEIGEFESYLGSSDYANYGVSNVRVAFRDKGYTKCYEGRTESFVFFDTEEGQPKEKRRAICFFADKVDA
jgi:hypothetical protein